MTEKDRIEIEMAKEEAERFRREMQKSGERTVSPNASQEPINTVEEILRLLTIDLIDVEGFGNTERNRMLAKAEKAINALIIQARVQELKELLNYYEDLRLDKRNGIRIYQVKDRITALESQLGKK